MSHDHDPEKPGCHDSESGKPTCREVFDLLSDYVDGELAREEHEALSRHLGACPPCEQFLKTFQKTRDLCRESLFEEMPDEMRSRLRSFFREEIRKKQ